jgi:hypothetical protein
LEISESGDELLIKNTWEFTDEFLMIYVRSRGYNVESAFERVSKILNFIVDRDLELKLRSKAECQMIVLTSY